MSNHIKIYLLLLLLTVSGQAIFSQKKDMQVAQSEFDDLQFNKAAEYYQKIIRQIKEDTPEKQYSTYMLAECYRMMNKSDKAEPYYKQLIGSTYADSNSVLYLRYATVLRSQGNLAGAKEYYKKYLEKKPDDTDAKTGLKSCEWILANQEKRAQVNIWNVKSINSGEDDFGPAFLDKNFDLLIFTSNRISEKTKLRDQWTGSDFSALYESANSGKNWGDPSLIEYSGIANAILHEGTPSLNGDFSTMYFTRCDRMAEKRIYCQIWKTDRTGDKWTEPRLVLADSTANIGQPSVSKDDLALLFASDMKGGAGGKDIWVVRRDSKDQDFGRPVPLGPGINTAGDEVFPYLFNDTTLYFSSDGYQGYGGWDIYKSIRRKNAWTAPENLQAPFNSGYDDFGIIIEKPDEEGFFCSNRPGGLGGDDIYQFTRKNLLFTISGKVKDKMTLLPIEGAKVFLIGKNADTAEFLTNGQGNFKFDTTLVLEDHDYELFFQKDNYFSKKETISTKLYKNDHDFIVDIMLDQIPEKPIVLPDILYGLDKWDLTPQYQDSLMQLVELLRTNKNLVIELRSHTDSRGSDDYNEALSQKRAQSVVDFLVSQGVDPARLVAKGYGKRISRVLDKDLVRENYLFKAGTELNDKFINSLPTEEAKEAAFQLNRRTEFSVLSKDYKP